MKKKSLIFLCILLLFVPTYISVTYYFATRDMPIETRNVSKVEAVDLWGNTLTSDNDSALKEDMLSMVRTSKTASALPDALAQSSFYTVNFFSYGEKTEYKFYITENPTECFYTDNKDRAYRIDADAATDFLESNAAQSIYASAAPAVLNICGKTVAPQNLDWKYKTYGGNLKPSVRSVSGGSDITDAGDISSNFACNFTYAPDSLKITVVNTANETIFTGTQQELSTFTVGENTNVTVTIEAQWSEESGAAYSGTGKYVITSVMHSPASFKLSQDTIYCGQFTVITGTNVFDISNITVTADPVINYTPVFFQDGNCVRALLPVSLDLGNTEATYGITVTTPESQQTLSLHVLARAQSVNNIFNISTDVVSALDLTHNPYSDIYTAIEANIKANTDFKTMYASGTFTNGFSTQYTRSSFGNFINFPEIAQAQFLTYDNLYCGVGDVTAANAGKVVYVGTQTYSGNLVVIDHGFGMLSWYSNLGTVNVTVGATVAKGDVLGSNADGGGLTEKIAGKSSSAHVAVSVFGVPVDISTLVSNGIVY